MPTNSVSLPSVFALAKKGGFACVQWDPEDLLEICPHMTIDQAAAWLREHEELIANAALQGGWVAIIHKLGLFENRG